MMYPCFQSNNLKNDENLRIESKSDIFIDARNILLRQVRAICFYIILNCHNMLQYLSRTEENNMQMRRIQFVFS